MSTLVKKFQSSVRKYPKKNALLFKKEGRYRGITYKELAEKVRLFASGLKALNVQRGDRIALLSENRVEWIICDLAMLHIGAVCVAMFPSYTVEQIRYIVTDSGSEIMIVSGQTQLEKALHMKESVPTLRTITMDCFPDPKKDVLTFERLLELGKENPISEIELNKLGEMVKDNDLVTIIYTSGTTGEPKGVMLSHKNFVSNIEAALEVIPYKTGEVILSVLPLNHVLPRMADYYTSITKGCCIALAESYATVRENALEVRPHYVTLVPRFFEAMREKLLKALDKEPARKKALVKTALEVGRKRCELLQARKGLPISLLVKWWLYDKLVLSKIRASLGMDRLKNFISGGAPLPRANALFFASLGLIILEGYGLTETSPVTNVNSPRRFKFGTVGPPLRNVQLRIADDGEILVKAPSVMLGYYKKEEETRKAIDEEGWFHTGDIGEIDEDGYLKITDRKKDIIVLASGKKVAPQPIENALQESPYISSAVLFGDKRTTITALIVPNLENVKTWAKLHNVHLEFSNLEALGENEKLRELIRSEIERLTVRLADFEKIHRFTLVMNEFCVESGEVTPTMKVRRKVVQEKYKDIIDKMYS